MKSIHAISYKILLFCIDSGRHQATKTKQVVSVAVSIKERSQQPQDAAMFRCKTSRH